jgi:MFS transporter, DHA1 family, inner membrane transport protein
VPHPPTTPHAAILATLTAATLGANAMPMLVGAMSTTLGLNAANAGWLAAAELAAVAASCLLLARRMGDLPRPVVAIVGGLLAAAGHGAALVLPALERSVSEWPAVLVNGQALAPQVFVFAATRVVAGLGEGMALAAFSASVASTPDPESVYAKALVLSVSFIGVVMGVLLPALSARLSLGGTFGALAACTLACLIFMPGLPNARGDDGRRTGVAIPHQRSGWLLIVSLAIFAAGEGATWAFAERIGHRIGMSYSRVGLTMGVASVIGVSAGAGLAGWLGSRHGRRLPLNLGLCAFALSALSLSLASTGRMYDLLVCCTVTSLYFLLPYYLGSASALDAQGRWASGSAGMYLVGNAVGPALAGVLIAGTGTFAALGWMALASCSIPFFMMQPVLRGIEQHHKRESST